MFAAPAPARDIFRYGGISAALPWHERQRLVVRLISSFSYHLEKIKKKHHHRRRRYHHHQFRIVFDLRTRVDEIWLSMNLGICCLFSLIDKTSYFSI